VSQQFDKQYYERDDISGLQPAPYQIRVLQDMLGSLPPGARSVLDVGCGDGFVTDSLPESLHVEGLDRSKQALARVKRKAHLGSSVGLPFPDRKFDLVMCNDVLEHLPQQDFAGTLHELARVSSHYALITVPFLEDLPAQMTRCGKCGALYHINHHQRAFGVPEMLSLFEGEGLKPYLFIFSGADLLPAEEIQRDIRHQMNILTQWEKACCPA
jgi:ubiquinone/menaquinone biosynthesis C-methylase UbiE